MDDRTAKAVQADRERIARGLMPYTGEYECVRFDPVEIARARSAAQDSPLMRAMRAVMASGAAQIR